MTEELSSAGEDILQCLFATWLDLSDLSTDHEPKARDRNIAFFRISVLYFFGFFVKFLFTIYFEYFTFVYF